MAPYKMKVKREGMNPNFLAFMNAKGLKDGDEIKPMEYGLFIDEETALHIKEKIKEPFYIYLCRKYKVYTDEEIEDILRKEKEEAERRLEQADKMAEYKQYLRSV